MLGHPDSAHIIKWATGLHNNGFKVVIFGLSNSSTNSYNNYPNITTVLLKFDYNFYKAENQDFKKLLYLKAIPVIRKLIKKHNPDILHAHYLSSYGALGAIVGFHPFILSVWGSDIFDFPKKSIFHKYYIKYILSKADHILSTSKIMKKEINKYTKQSIEVTPFGIDIDFFRPCKRSNSSNEITLGVVKSLEDRYGIDYLLKAFKLFIDLYPSIIIRLIIVGGGTKEFALKTLSRELGISNFVQFTGAVDYSEIVEYYNLFDIAVLPSLSESFGVAALEASACEIPVIATNVGGLPEVIAHEITGLIIESKNTKAIADALYLLVKNPLMRKFLGENGRRFVCENYNFKDNLQLMLKIYRKSLRVNPDFIK
jgi:glycosyltransferase involved in cell wall biosynthesis